MLSGSWYVYCTVWKHRKSWGVFWLWFMVFNTTFNNISVISWLSVYWWRKPEYPEKTTDMSQVTESCFFTEICRLLYHSVNVYKTTVMSWQGILEWTLKDKASTKYILTIISGQYSTFIHGNIPLPSTCKYIYSGYQEKVIKQV
jgi:hypothetical protein